MKKLIGMLLTVVMACCLLSFGASAADADILDSGTCGDNLTWTLTKKGVLTVSGAGDMYDYDLDSNKAPWQSWNIQKIVIQDGVTSVGDYAFYDQYYYLSNVDLGNTVTSIGACAFYNSYGYMTYEQLTIPASVTVIETEAFGGQGGRAYLFEGDMPQIGENAFRDCMAAFVCPYGNSSWTEEAVKAICPDLTMIPCGGNGFEYKGFGGNKGSGNIYWCYNATTDTLWITGSGEMYDYTYRTDAPWIDEGYDKSVREVIIDEGITAIGNWSFELCYGLRSVQIPDSVTYIGEYAFRCCGLESVEIPAAVSYIGECAFISCDELATVVFKGSAPEMDCKAFNDTITYAYFPAGDASWDGVTSLNYGGYLDWQPYSLETKPAPGLAEKPAYDYGDIQWTFDNATGTLTISGVGKMFDIGEKSWQQHKNDTVHLVIADGVESIGNEAFDGFGKLETITMADSVKAIGCNAFSNCGVLRCAELSNNLKIIREKAFENCTSLAKIDIPDQVFYLGENAFFFCSALAEARLPASLTWLREGVFMSTGLNSLEIPAGVTRIDNFVFYYSTVNSVRFLGNAPAFGAEAFKEAAFAAHYPQNDPTWTSDVMKRYGGKVTWVPYESENVVIAGDTDGDGIVDSNDVARLLWYTLFSGSIEITGDADFNHDGIIDDKDVAYLLWHTLFPENFPLS